MRGPIRPRLNVYPANLEKIAGDLLQRLKTFEALPVAIRGERCLQLGMQLSEEALEIAMLLDCGDRFWGEFFDRFSILSIWPNE